jgi:hypothetical protein
MRFAAEINVLKSRIAAYNEDLISCQLQRDGTAEHRGAAIEKEELEAEIARLEQDTIRQEEKIKHMENDRVLKQATYSLTQAEEMLEKAKNKLQKLSNTQDLDARLALLELEQVQREHMINVLTLKRQNLEIIIATQGESAKRLRMLAELITHSSNPVEESMLSCLHFMRLFDKNKDEIEKLIIK